jgi:hypothetical protein
MKTLLVAGSMLLVAFGAARAQTSANFKVAESVINAGGNPNDATRPASASFRVSFAAIGDAAMRSAPSSTSYRGDVGLIARYRPPGEVQSLRFLDKVNLAWNHEPSMGTYNLYRNTLATLPGNFGGCYQSALSQPQFGEIDMPLAGPGWFYLVTARNRLREEGTKGTMTGGAVRSNTSPCP